MPDNTIEWGQGAVNNTNDWGKAKANSTNGFGAVYDDSPSGDTNIAGGTGVALSISYSASAFCEDASDPTPTVTGNVGAGTFSSTAGLVFVSASTGEVDISASTSGATYLITYTDTNSATATFNLTINDLDDATFAYSQSSYSPTDTDPTPTITGLAGGTFSAGSGLVFVDSGSNTGSSTGEIDLSASTVASYTVTYTTAGTCPNTSTQSVEIAAALAQVNNVYSMEFDGVNDRISIPTIQIPINSNYSVSFWFKGNNSILNDVMIGGASGHYFPYLALTSGNIKVYVKNQSITRSILTDVTYAADTWYHLVISQGVTNTVAYINGVNKGNVASINSGTSIAITTIASYEDGYSIYEFNGFIDEVAFFNTALTQDQVSSIYNATEVVAGVSKTADLNDLTTPPVKWYRMGD